MRAETFEELDVYRKAFRLQQRVFDVSKTFPREEAYSLTDQMRRSSRSVGANIAEAWKKRRYIAHFRSKLTDSDAEAAETRHWLYTAHASGYIDERTRDELAATTREVGKMLGAMIRDADRWCSSTK